MNKSHRRFPPQASFTTRLERLWLGFCVGSLACSPAAKIPPPHDLTSPAPAEGAEHARRSNDEFNGEIARQPLARETREPVALSESEASALAIDHLAQNVANGTLPDSFVRPPRCTHSCVSMDRSKSVRLCRNWSCYFLFSDRVAPPVAGFVVHVGESPPRAFPEVEACVAKEHGCAIVVSRDEAMKRLQATLSELDLKWNEDDGEFFWVNLTSNKRISCHRRSGTTK